MKNFRNDLDRDTRFSISFSLFPLVLAQMGGEMKKQMISDFNIAGLAEQCTWPRSFGYDVIYLWIRLFRDMCSLWSILLD